MLMADPRRDAVWSHLENHPYLQRQAGFPGIVIGAILDEVC